MSTSPTSALREVLDKTSILEVSMDDIASSMEATTWMHCLVPVDEPNAEVDDDDEEGSQQSAALPRFFTDTEALHEHATANSEYGELGTYNSRSEPLLVALMRLWHEGAEGIVLDAGGGISLNLDRSNMRALIMAFAVEWFVSPSELCIVMRQGRVYYHTNGTGQKMAFIFTKRGSAFENLKRMRNSVPSLIVAPVDPMLVLEGTLGAGVDRLIVDPGLPNERSLSTDNLETIRSIRLGCEKEYEVIATAESFEVVEEDPAALDDLIGEISTPNAQKVLEQTVEVEEPEERAVENDEDSNHAFTRDENEIADEQAQSAEMSASEPVAEESQALVDDFLQIADEDCVDQSLEENAVLGSESGRINSEVEEAAEHARKSAEEALVSDFLDAVVPSEDEIVESEAPDERSVESEIRIFEPRRAREEAHDRLMEIKALADSDPDNGWRATELYAHDLDLWVPISRANADGKVWPTVINVADGAGNPVPRTSVFTSEEEGLESIARLTEPQDLYPLVGFEAFQWIWSSPQNAVEILIDPNAHDGGVKLHRNSIPAMIFPPILGLKGLSAVPEIDFDLLAELEGSHGLKPEVIRAFGLNWSSLLGPPPSDAQSEIEFDGGKYLPVFSDDEHYQAYVRGTGTHIQRPVQSSESPQFINWLRISSRCNGIVLNPPIDGVDDGKTLTLDSVELFHLQLWADFLSQPDGSQVINALAELQKGDYAADQKVTGQIAADWPLYIAGMTRGSIGIQLVKVPGTDDLALFTGERELAEFKRTYRTEDPSLDDVQPHHMLPRWCSSFFNLANANFSGLCINPGSGATPKGVHLDGKGLDGALERLDYRLRPRVPGFESKDE